MKVDPVVTNSDELLMTNLSQSNKIKYLEQCQQKRQTYIKDLQKSLQLNKQSMLALSMNGTTQISQLVKKCNDQTTHLSELLKKYYDDCMNLNALLLIEQQLRIQQRKAYSQRLLQFETNMIELRKYLIDKEESFSSVVQRLGKYEDLSQVSLETKLHHFSAEFNENGGRAFIEKVIEERDHYKALWEEVGLGVEQMRVLKQCLENQKKYQQMKEIYQKVKKSTTSQQDSKPLPKRQTNSKTTSQNTVYKNPNKQLIKLLKKERLNNEILQQAFNEAIQKNQELIVQNQVLAEANQNLQIKVEKLQAKCYLLEQELTRYDRSLAWDQKWKSRCDADRVKRIQQFQAKGQQKQIHLISLEQDMQKLSSFILCHPLTPNLGKSSSQPSLSQPLPSPQNQEEGGEQLGIEEI